MKWANLERRGRAALLAASVALVPYPAWAQATATARSRAGPPQSRAHVERLASPELEGRLTGSSGADTAATYLVAAAAADRRPAAARHSPTSARRSSSPPA